MVKVAKKNNLKLSVAYQKLAVYKSRKTWLLVQFPLEEFESSDMK